VPESAGWYLSVQLIVTSKEGVGTVDRRGEAAAQSL
jgi:hypothetical protein